MHAIAWAGQGRGDVLALPGGGHLFQHLCWAPAGHGMPWHCDSTKSGSCFDTWAPPGPPAAPRAGGPVSTAALSSASQVEPTVVSISSTSGFLSVIFASVNGNRLSIYFSFCGPPAGNDRILVYCWPWLDVKEWLRRKRFHLPFPDPWAIISFCPTKQCTVFNKIYCHCFEYARAI